MNQSVRDTLKKVIAQLRPQHTPIAFTVLLGLSQQGKSTFMQQSAFQHLPTNDNALNIYFNREGIVVEISSSLQEKASFQSLLKQLNRCHKLVRISGVLLCVDINDMLKAENDTLKKIIAAHLKCLSSAAEVLPSSLPLGIVCTKLDLLAGFCDFFQHANPSEHQQPLGFSIETTKESLTTDEGFKTQFDQLIVTLGQTVIHKIHPVRSSVKRTLIREFPLQLAGLRNILLPLVTRIPTHFKLQALYFTSSTQSGLSIDWLNKKIKREYALTLQDQFHQADNHRAYFTQSSVNHFQESTKIPPPVWSRRQQTMLGLLIGGAMLAVIWMGQRYYHASNWLDKASRELIALDMNDIQKKDGSNTLHLAKAAEALALVPSNAMLTPTIQTLKNKLHANTKQVIDERFLPGLMQEVEAVMQNASTSPVARYQALKIYLMLGSLEHRNNKVVLSWFREAWKASVNQNTIDSQLNLLQQILKDTHKPLPIQKQLVTDTRNFLNALPTSYLFYSLAKTEFAQTTIPLETHGFSVSSNIAPMYLTKPGFQMVLTDLPHIVKTLEAENWVLERQDLGNLLKLLQQAYCYEYVIWWQHWIKAAHPKHARNEKEAYQLIKTLRQTNTIGQLIHTLQQQTSPDPQSRTPLFNQEIASQFSELNLISESSIRQFSETLAELEKFLQTLSVVQDQGKTAYQITKARFAGDVLANPLSALYHQASQLPEPMSTFAKTLADDIWFNLINQSRAYLNQQWQTLVFQPYQNTIANRYPFDPSGTDDIPMVHFERFFGTHGLLNHFVDDYLSAFLDRTEPQWKLKDVNNYVMPIASDMLNEIIRANVITHMFFPNGSDKSDVEFTLQKVSLDPIIANLQLSLGDTQLKDTQSSDSMTEFHWPKSNARLVVNSIEGRHYELEELGLWGFFKLLQKVNVLVDEQNSANLQIIFEINGNSGRYLLKAQHAVNPFIPGVLNEFSLTETIV